VKLRILAATLGAVTLAGGAGLGAVALSRPEVVVERVVDGDTIVVRIGDTTETVHLLNIDAPESTSLDKPVECLGPEAADFLKTRLPEGTVITLKHDKRRWDKHGHLLAGVYESGSLVNAEIAAAGLAAPTVFEPNRQLYPEIRAAAVEAREKKLGAHSPAVECALPVQVQALVLASQAVDPDRPLPDTSAAGNAEMAGLKSQVAVAETLLALLDGGTADDPSIVAFYPSECVDEMRSQVQEAASRLGKRMTALRKRQEVLVESERQAREQEERKAREAATGKVGGQEQRRVRDGGADHTERAPGECGGDRTKNCAGNRSSR